MPLMPSKLSAGLGGTSGGAGGRVKRGVEAAAEVS